MKRIVYAGKIIFGSGLLLLIMNSCKNEQKDIPPMPSSEKHNMPKSETKDAEDDSAFLTDVAEINFMEIEMGKLAYQKGVREDVKKYAKMLIDDHTKSFEELKSLANKNTITLPTAFSETGREKYNKLNELGSDFDQKFVDLMVESSEKAVDKMTEISQKATSEDFKLWASRQTSIFVNHYEEAKKLKAKFGGASN